MTLKTAKELLPIIKEFSEEKQIQYFNIIYNKWEDIDSPKFDDEPSRYRIKPEQKYRPFKNVQEYWDEMKKHPPIGWIKTKSLPHFYYIDITKHKNYNYYFNIYTFADDSPFGIKEE